MVFDMKYILDTMSTNFSIIGFTIMGLTIIGIGINIALVRCMDEHTGLYIGHFDDVS